MRTATTKAGSRRALKAFLVAPLVVPLAMALFTGTGQGGLTALLRIMAIGTAAGYLAALIIGVPAYRLFQSGTRRGIFAAAFGGFVIGGVLWQLLLIVLVLVNGGGLASLRRLLTASSNLLIGGSIGGSVGAVFAIVVWLIARPDRR